MTACLLAPAPMYAGTLFGSAGAASEQTRSRASQMADEALQLVERDRLDEASAAINRALQLEVRNSYFHLLNGLIYHLQALRGGNGNYELAAQGYEQAIQFDRSNWLALYFGGVLAAQQKQYDRAKSLLAQAMLLRKNDRSLLNTLAYSAYRAGAPDVAAGAIAALESNGGLNSAAELRNAAMIMAALRNSAAELRPPLLSRAAIAPAATSGAPAR